jgi:type VI secretion system secreted protein Hcp
MINKKALLVVAVALVTALILSSLTVTRTAHSEETQGNPDILMFLQIDGVPGESTQELHRDWIDIDAFNWSEAMAGITATVSGRSAGKVIMTDFHFAMKTNKASPSLFLDCAIGKYIPNARLDVCRPFGAENQGPLVYLRFNFTQVTITSYSIGGSSPMDRSVDEFSIAFSKITMTYIQIGEDGSIISVINAYYDLAAGKGGFIQPTQ